MYIKLHLKGNVLPLQAHKAEFSPENPCKKLRHMIYACKLSLKEVETGKSSGFPNQLVSHI